MNDFLKTACTQDVVECLYTIFLGRDPEVEHPWIGEPVVQLISTIAESDEFQNRCSAILRAAPEAQFECRDSPSLSKIPAFLDAIGARPSRTKTWPDFLLSAIESLDQIIGSNRVPDNAKLVASLISEEYSVERDSEDFINEIINFDAEWFIRVNRAVPALALADESKLEAMAALMATNGEAELSPFFSISGPNNYDLRRSIFGNKKRPEEFSLQDVLYRIKIAFKRRLITHWLFNAEYYLSQRAVAFTGGYVNPWVPYADPYLDFLANGDRNKIRPHWLFCPATYSKLNGTLELKHSFFRHL